MRCIDTDEPGSEAGGVLAENRECERLVPQTRQGVLTVVGTAHARLIREMLDDDRRAFGEDDPGDPPQGPVLAERVDPRHLRADQARQPDGELGVHRRNLGPDLGGQSAISERHSRTGAVRLRCCESPEGAHAVSGDYPAAMSVVDWRPNGSPSRNSGTPSIVRSLPIETASGITSSGSAAASGMWTV